MGSLRSTWEYIHKYHDNIVDTKCYLKNTLLSASIRQGASLSNTVWSSNLKGSLNIYWKSNWKHMDEWSCTWILHSCHWYYKLSGSTLQVSRRRETATTPCHPSQHSKGRLHWWGHSCKLDLPLCMHICTPASECWSSRCSKAWVLALALHSWDKPTDLLGMNIWYGNRFDIK